MKKIISLLVITTMIFSMVASLNIMSVYADGDEDMEIPYIIGGTPTNSDYYLNTIKFHLTQKQTNGSINARAVQTSEDSRVKYITALQLSTDSNKTTSHYYKSSKLDENNVTYDFTDEVLKLGLARNSSKDEKFTLIQGAYKDFDTHFPSGKTNTLLTSYDVKIPDGTEDVTRDHAVALGNVKGKGNNTISMEYSSKINNNKIWLAFSSYSETTVYDDTKVTSPFTLESGKWYKVIEALEITDVKNRTQFDWRLKLYVYNLETREMHKVEEVEGCLKKNTGLKFVSTRITFVVPKGEGPVTTQIDNYLWRKIEGVVPLKWSDNDSDLALYRNADDKTITIAGKNNTNSGKQKVILAAYDANGNVVDGEVIVRDANNSSVDDTTDAVYFTYDYSTNSKISKIKAFMFDKFPDCKPLANISVLKVR